MDQEVFESYTLGRLADRPRHTHNSIHFAKPASPTCGRSEELSLELAIQLDEVNL